HEHQRIRGNERDRREIALRIVRELGIDGGRSGERRGVEQQGMAVGRRFRDDGGADRAAGAGAVVDHDLLAPGGDQLRSVHAGEQIGRAARGEGNDDPDRLAGIARVLSAYGGCSEDGSDKRNSTYAETHGQLLLAVGYSAVRLHQMVRSEPATYACRRPPATRGRVDRAAQRPRRGVAAARSGSYRPSPARVVYYSLPI